MPPKVKKQKTKTKTEKVKAVATTKRGGAQAQVQNVVVKVGETKKPVRRRRKPSTAPNPKGVPPPRPPPPFLGGYDGYYPPQNLTRNGSFPYEISRDRFIAGVPPQQTTFTQVAQEQALEPSAPPMPEEAPAPVLEPDSGFNVTEFLRQAKLPKQKEMYDPFMTPEYPSLNRVNPLVPPSPEPSSFVETFELEPPEPYMPEPEPEAPKKKPFIIVEDEMETGPAPAITEIRAKTQANIIREIKDVEKKLREDGVIGSDMKSRKAFNKEIYVDLFGRPKESEYSKYNRTELQMIRDRIRERYGV